MDIPELHIGVELVVVTNGSDSGSDTPLLLPDRRSSMTHNQRQNRMLMIGGALWALSYVVNGVALFATDNGTKYSRSSWAALFGLVQLVQAVLQTVGAMVVAAADADLDLFAKQHPRCVCAFVFLWIVLYVGLRALTPPIQNVNQAFWLGALPFAYLLLRFRPVLQMRRENYYPRFSDLLAWSLSLDLGSLGVNFILVAHTGPFSALPFDIVGALFFLGFALVFGSYQFLCNTQSRRVALSTTLYVYILAFGACVLATNLVQQYAYHFPTSLIEYSFPIIHIGFPLAYFLFRRLIYRFLGRHWLRQRSANAESVAQEQRIAPHHGDLAAVERAISAGAGLNAHIEHENSAADAFTLLILACFNHHHDAVDLLLSQDDVQVNKGSLRQHWTPLYVAAMRGNTASVGKLLVRGANVHAKTEDEQSALLAATTFGHTQVVQQLMEAGASLKHSAWMGIDASAAAEELQRVSIVASMRSYESHFQGHIREVRGCSCVASWPGIYSKSW
jgi:hypothetical protein